MAGNGPKQPTQSQPTREASETPEWIKAINQLGRTLIRSPAEDVAPERSGQLSPSHTPGHAAEGDASGTAANARYPAAEESQPDRPLPSSGDSLRDRSRFLPPASGRGRGGPER